MFVHVMESHEHLRMKTFDEKRRRENTVQIDLPPLRVVIERELAATP